MAVVSRVAVTVTGCTSVEVTVAPRVEVTSSSRTLVLVVSRVSVVPVVAVASAVDVIVSSSVAVAWRVDVAVAVGGVRVAVLPATPREAQKSCGAGRALRARTTSACDVQKGTAEGGGRHFLPPPCL